MRTDEVDYESMGASGDTIFWFIGLIVFGIVIFGLYLIVTGQAYDESKPTTWKEHFKDSPLAIPYHIIRILMGKHNK